MCYMACDLVDALTWQVLTDRWEMALAIVVLSDSQDSAVCNQCPVLCHPQGWVTVGCRAFALESQGNFGKLIQGQHPLWLEQWTSILYLSFIWVNALVCDSNLCLVFLYWAIIPALIWQSRRPTQQTVLFVAKGLSKTDPNTRPNLNHKWDIN